MTIICYDGKILAGDRRITSGHTISTSTKIFRVKDGIIGFAGVASAINAFLEWFEKDRALFSFNERLYEPEFGVQALFIDYHKKIWQFDWSPSPYLITEKKAAIGSGDETGLAAMMCGKTAIEAVKIVSLLNCSCGNGYDSLTLKEK